MYKIVQITKDSLKDLIPLYKSAFHKNYSIKYLQKKFNTLHFGAEYIGYMAYSNGIVVACYVVFPCRMSYKGEAILAAQSGDTMTHPEHRNKGLFIQLATKTFELANAKGIKFIFGFPNKNSYNGFINRLSWIHSTNMNLYKIKVRTVTIAKICAKIKLLSILYQTYLKVLLIFYKTSDSIVCSVTDENKIAIESSKDYLKYKTYGESFILNIKGVKVWAKINGALLVGDIEQTVKENIPVIISRLKTFAIITGCRDIVFNFSKGEYWDVELSKFSKPEKGFSIAYFDLESGLPLEKLAFSLSVLDTF